MKILKLKHRNHVNIMHTQKPIDHFNTKHAISSKAPNFLMYEIFRILKDLWMNACNLIKKKIEL